MLQLIIDERERNVTRHADEFKTKHYTVNYIIKQITVGDYILADIDPKNPSIIKKIHAVFERKSLEDFAASIKDGRSDNKNKLAQLRRETGCRIIYIIEMPGVKSPHPEPDQTFGRIPYINIESSIFHLMLEYDITVMWTGSTVDTAKTLARFVRSTDTLLARRPDALDHHLSVDGLSITGGSVINMPATADLNFDNINLDNINLDNLNLDNATVSITNNNIIADNNSITDVISFSDVEVVDNVAINTDHNAADNNIIAENNDLDAVVDLNARIVQRTEADPRDVLRSMWAVFKGISVESADEFISKFTLKQIIRREVARNVLDNLKTATGRKVSAPVIKALKMDDAVVAKSVCVRMMSRIPGISEATAHQILSTLPLDVLLSYSREGMSMISLTTKSSKGVPKMRRLGDKCADNIIKYFNMGGDGCNGNKK